jgi:hypothetical protein
MHELVFIGSDDYFRIVECCDKLIEILIENNNIKIKYTDELLKYDFYKSLNRRNTKTFKKACFIMNQSEIKHDEFINLLINLNI